ncbi:hypothetical protein RB195_007989 [Necator americanus]|uniref:Vacuolar protein sorting-associated protein 13A n=1 Tax=Necator americanus TaxID=51031 RepID=A0ABR1BZZ3_NECAM
MVFESLVADLLNRFLGDFVDNLDASQLNIGIWGGDVKLENLEVKETALDDLDLPVKLKFGYLSSLVLKIPWKNLYNEPVIATIDGLYLIVVPNKGVVYNEEKAKKNAAEIKQKTLARLEEARKNRRKPPDPAQDSFVEKMVTQVIKNLQVSVSSIHIRFEDKYTNRHRPFVAGVTLEKLDFQTTNENPTIHRDVVKIFHKLVLLDNLSLYWNSDSELFSDLHDKMEIRRKLKATIHTGKSPPAGYKYILEPITMEAKLKLNQKPETDGTNWQTPKIDLSVDMKTLALAIGKFQYQDILLFLEAQERFNLATQYLKYRPNLNEFKGHYKEWWHFAYKAILEEKVRRRRNNWSWPRMREHRKLVRDYRDAWVKVLTEKSPGAAVEEIVKKAEEQLDVFNVNVARQQAEMDIDRKGLKRVEDQPQGWLAWGKSWFGGGEESTTPTGKKKDFADQFNEAMTPEEKAKLFEAIDYQENIPPTNYPKEFVENKFDFRLGQVAVIVDGAVSLFLLDLRAYVEQRPSANAMNLKSIIQELRMDGCGAEMLRVRDPSKPWLNLCVDTNPLNGEYDQFVQLAIAPINLKYHAPAVNNAADVFKPPESVKLNQLTAAAMSRYEEVKARSATGLAHAVENRSRLVLDIQIQPATIYISEGGIYNANKPTILADLGLLSITTIESDPNALAHQDKLHQLMDKAYDKFRVKLSNVVVSMAENVAKGRASLGDKESPLHILKPTGLDIQIHKCSIDDLRLPRMRVIGALPDIVIGISDVRLLELTRLLLSIPKPEPDLEAAAIEEKILESTEVKVKDRAKMKTIMEVQEIESDEQPNQEAAEAEKSKTSEQQVQVELDLHLNQIGVIVLRRDEVLCEVSILRMGCKLQMRTFDMVVTAELGAVRVSMPMFKSIDPKRKCLYFIDNDEEEGSLMTLKFVQANPESPFFATEYHSTEQFIEFKFRKLSVSLHQEGLMELKQFGEKMQKEINDLQKDSEKPVQQAIEQGARKLSRQVSESVESLAAVSREAQTQAAAGKKRRTKRSQSVEEEDAARVIKMRLEATIGSLAVAIGTENSLDTWVAIENIRADVKMTVKVMNVTATLKTVRMEDMTEGSLYKKLLSVAGDKEMLRFEMVQYQRTDEQKRAMQPTDIDMSVKVRLAQMRFVFLNLWLCRLMAWMAPFQAEAARAAAAAQAAASEKAAEAAQNVKQMLAESPPRIQLDVQLEAPVIVLPQLSTSHNVVVLILGKLVVANHITGDRQNQKLIMDRMEVKLMNMTFGIGRMSDDASAVETSCDILEPLSFNIAVHRNLVFAAVKDLPELTVDAQIPSLVVNMSEHDYNTLMQTLSGNLAEGTELTAVPPPLPVCSDTVDSSEGETTGDKGEEDKLQLEKKKVAGKSSSAPKAVTPPPTPVETPKPKIVFQFTLDNIVAVLYTGGADQGSTRAATDAFAAMRLHGLKLSGTIKEDNSMNVAISLNTFTMADERREKTKIHQLLDKKSTNQGDRFLALAFSQDAKQNKNVKLKMSAFFICLCPEFLGCLTRFFTVDKSPEDLENEMEAIKAVGTQTKATAAQSTGSAEKDSADTPPPSIVLDCNMQGVEVILVENSMKPDTTQALILSFNMKMVANPSETEQVMSGGIEKLSMYSSYYAPSRRNEVTYEVLKPMNIGIEVRIDTPTKATDVILKMSPMEVRMAPSIIRLLSAVNTEFAKSSAVDEKSTTVSSPKLRSFPNYWKPKRIDQKKFFFFLAPTAEEACEEDENEAKDASTRAPIEHAHVEMERINFTLESGDSSVPVPLVFMQILLNAEASGWSSALQASADLSLQMSYYNEALSVWEPVIEPVEVSTDNWAPWNLKMTVKGRNKLDPSDTRPGMDVKIDADDILNITVTKSLLSLLNKVSETFAHAAKQISPPSSRQLPGSSPFLVLNETGIIIKLADSETLQVSESGGEIEAPHGRFVDLRMNKETAAVAEESQDKERLSTNQVELSADLRINLLDTVRQLKIGRAGKVAIPLPKKSDGGKQWKIIAETSIENGRRLVTLTSHVEVTNHLDVPMELYSKNSTNLDVFGIVGPGETLKLVVPLLFSPTGEIYFRPANDKCEVSFESVTWHQFTHQKRQVIRCDLSEDTTQGFFFETVVLEEKVREGVDQSTEVYSLHLYPPLQFHNILPFPITFEIPVAMDLAPGENVQLNLVPGLRMRLWAPYLGEMYSLDMTIPEEKHDLEVVALNTETGSSELLLGIHWSTEHGDLKAYLYAPFWLVNNTSMTLKHMESGGNLLRNTTQCMPCRKAQPSQQELEYAVKHLPDENPLILPFPSTDFTKKKKSRVLVDEAGSWSQEFPLDTVGNPARVTCKGKDRDYELTVDIKLCQSGLTKIVTFCPFYLVSNLGKWNMQVREEGQSTWVDVPAEKCVGIWPQQRSKRKFLCARYVGQQEESLLFPITENFETLCHIDNDNIGVEVCVSTSESSVAIHLTPFQPGMAPVCIMNHLNMPVNFGQKGHTMKTVGTNEMAFFTWDNVTENRIFEFSVGDHNGEDKLDQNRLLDIQLDSKVRKFAYLANFLIGSQRFILFTRDLDIARSAYGSWETDNVDLQAEVALQGVGLSIVDNSVGKELLYIGISSSDILWEEEVKKGRFKPFAVKIMQGLEEKYQEHLLEPKNGFQPIDQFEVCLETMIMKKKKGKEVKIRRIFEKGIWANYGKSTERTRMHLKVNHLQVDNQLETCVFPRVLAVVPPPKSVVADNAPKPFIEISLLQRQSEFSTVPEIEYARVLVQEFAVQVDQGLINALLALIASEVNKQAYGKEMFETDMNTTSVRLEDTAKQYRSNQPRSFYNDLHISPLMIHLSFSQGGTTGGGSSPAMPIQSEFFKVLFQSVGVSVTELQDVVFKLAYFERKCVFYRSDQLNSEIISHYTMQALRQMYVLVLGLDIIGNPFGLVRDLSAGVEDLFYQPFQGLIQGPEEFASGVALGVQSMFGHAVGGAAGAVGRITGTVGKGVAALTFDAEYQRKRQEDLNRRPQSFGEGMARGVKGLGMGVVEGITGVVTKPIEGAKHEGGLGFVKGVGKGLIGVVTRPVSGVVDFASSTMHSVRTVAGAGKEAGALRPPRVIRPDHIIRPYSQHEALGFKIFNDTERGELAETDEFITYAPITDRIVLLVTNEQLVLTKRTDIMGTWAVDWQTEYDKIKEPIFVENGIKLVLKEKKRGFLGIGSTEGKIITFENADAIQQKVLAAYKAATELPP